MASCGVSPYPGAQPVHRYAKPMRSAFNEAGKPSSSSAMRGGQMILPQALKGTACTPLDDDTSTVASWTSAASPAGTQQSSDDEGCTSSPDRSAASLVRRQEGDSRKAGCTGAAACGTEAWKSSDARGLPDASESFSAWQRLRMENWAASQHARAPPPNVDHHSAAGRSSPPASVLWLSVGASEAQPDSFPVDSSLARRAYVSESPDSRPSSRSLAQATSSKNKIQESTVQAIPSKSRIQQSTEEVFNSEHSGEDHQEHLTAGIMCLPTAGERELLSGSSVLHGSGGAWGHEDKSGPEQCAVHEEEVQGLVVGCPPQSDFFYLPSIGSAQHFAFRCRPCAHIWRPDGCSKGAGCTYCHLCGFQEWLTYKRIYKQFREEQRQAAEVQVGRRHRAQADKAAAVKQAARPQATFCPRP